MSEQRLIVGQFLPTDLSYLVVAYCVPIEFQGHTDLVWALCVSSDNKYLFSASLDQTIRQWSLETGECLQTLQGHIAWVNCLVISPDNKYLYSGSSDNTIRQWAVSEQPTGLFLEAGKCLQILQGHIQSVFSLAISSDNKYLYSGSMDNTIRQWVIGEKLVGPSQNPGECLRILRGHGGIVYCLVLSSDNKYLYSASEDSTIRQWAVGDDESVGSSRKLGECLQTLQGHTHCVYTLALSFDNRYLYSGSWDRTIRQWTVNHDTGHINGTGRLLSHTNAVSSLVLSSDNQFLYSGSWDKTIRQWYVGNEQQNMVSQILFTIPHTHFIHKHDSFFLDSGKIIHRLQWKSYRDGYG